MLGAPYHPQIQGAIEAFNNTFKNDFIKLTLIYQNLVKRIRKRV